MMTMPTEDMLRAILSNLIRCGQKDSVARKALAMKYPDQEGTIWDLDLDSEPKDVIRIKISNKDVNKFCQVEENIMSDELVTDLDVSAITDTEKDIEEEVEVVSAPVQTVKTTRKPRATKTVKTAAPVKKETKIARARVLYLNAEDKNQKVIKELFMKELDMSASTAYIYAKVVAKEIDDAKPS